jgi:plasmid stabilization system protein ParE
LATVIFHRLAAREYLAARRRYARRNPAVAQRFTAAIDVTVQRIGAAPDQGAVYRGRFRWRKSPRFLFLLYYLEVGPGLVMVMAVAHGSRRQGYWRRRTP